MFKVLFVMPSLFALIAALSPLHALADSPPAKVLGWSRTANLGLNLAFTSSESVVGQSDGSTQTYGTNLKGGLNRVSESDEWRNTLSVIGATTRTPSVPRYVKSNDEAKLETMYIYAIPSLPEIGPFVSGEVSAPMFKGEDVQSTEKTYRVVTRNSADRVVKASSLRLTDGFRPLTTKESVGLLWKAVSHDNLKVEARAGFGALQINADGQLTVQGNNAAGEIAVGELANVSQGGLEVGLTAKGKIDDKSSYEAGVGALTPFINNKPSGDKRDAIGLTNVDGYGKLTSNITSWAAFGYDYKLKIQPQLQVRAEQTHMLVLNINYNLF